MSKLGVHLIRVKPGHKYAELEEVRDGPYCWSVKATRVAALLYVNFLFVVFGFPLQARLVFILHIYICSSRTCEKNCHILIGYLFVNLRLNDEMIYEIDHIWTADMKSSEAMILAVVNAILQLRKEDWKIQDFNGVWTRDLAIPVRRSNQLSYEATDDGSWSFVGSNVLVRNESTMKWYMK